MEKTEMELLDIEKRKTTFEEVALGYSEQEAIKEANRCLNCKKPMCVTGCPVNINIPKFIEQIKNGNPTKAYEIISENSALPRICGRVCPQEKQCEGKCVKGLKGDAIKIGALERFASDNAKRGALLNKEKNGKKVSIIGSGPSSLTCAADLLNLGYDITIYEAFHKCGGVLTYGIPEFRLPKNIVEDEINKLRILGAKIETDTLIGKTISLSELENEYDAIFIGTGAGLPKFMGINNENALGVFSANEILTRINLMESYKDDTLTPIMDGKDVIVVGGGNVAMDAARSLKRLNKNVTICYRRGEDELPARKEEVMHAKEEGINFSLLTNPKEINVNDEGFVTSISVVDMELVDNGDERKNVKEIEGSMHEIPCDMVVMAIGTNPNPTLVSNSDIECDKGHIIVDGSKTNNPKIFAGGDAVTGSATVILAMEAGKKAALEIHKYLSN